MAQRVNISSNSKWENIVSYSRAVQIGNVMEISGTTSSNGEEIIGKGDAYLQTQFILQKISGTLEQNGFHLKDVIRTRIYVTDISLWEEVAKAHTEYFSEIRPATTMVEISRLIHPDLLIEIEASAILQMI